MSSSVAAARGGESLTKTWLSWLGFAYAEVAAHVAAICTRPRFFRGCSPGRSDLVIVLVDEDGEPSRAKALEEVVAHSSVPAVIGVAAREFESWLLHDTQAVTNVLGSSFSQPPSVEGMAPGEAKARLRNLIGPGDEIEVRMRLASACDLEHLTKLRAFERFWKQLQRTLGSV